VWFEECVGGTSRRELGLVQSPDESFRPAEDDTVASVTAAHREACATARAAIAGLSLDTVVTGHRREGEHDVDWRSLANVGGTIVILMGVSQRGQIASELMAGGLDPETPVAAVRSATTERQTVVRCLLSELSATSIESPAVIVIGPVASLDLAPPQSYDS
jgi:siroheme synthase